jgi:hypothetical protein
VVGVELLGSAPESGAGGGLLVPVGLYVGQPSVVVHGAVQVFLALAGRVQHYPSAWTRWPRPGWILPSFFASMWISSPAI